MNEFKASLSYIVRPYLKKTEQNKTKQQHEGHARLQWLTPVILPTWESEIGRIKVQRPVRASSLRDLISKIN
jgi:hypothetical protein